ncbi:ceramide phosphoethanolamine synthase-like [Ruditapes philippinarum]|uniref:ceramide phosphoethanolamine synthase-like n=1 Tax=Ruditapes philippinarum TaxID=129788 RepID=UPI00295B7C08|nr:ceramide phosphoethanolamine synthase-like [Ruditapes philippinarum]XP_060558006.1 ceramide phosphoethanolamine synthase-like [Ruditapes philippinarum]XP_060558013.1 ceramide phosphoethanolamine synthase-like [Ruditapes philippinarum]
MQQIYAAISQHQRTIFGVLGLTIACYYLLMDGVLYSTLQSVDLVNQKPAKPGQSWSPFHPLSIKLIMTDPTTHYVITPLSENFNRVTKFSQIFYFITPNMITFTHLILAFISAKFVFSESLQNRRIGVLLFELRSFLDAFDGTVYRSHATVKAYKSDHSNFGFWFDCTADTIGGFALMFGALFFLWWKCPPGTDSSATTLPWSADDINDAKNDLVTEKPIKRTQFGYSKQFIFLRCLSFGMQTGVSSAIWDQLTMRVEKVFLTKLDDPELVTLQSLALHSTTTWLIFWFWRIMCGQSLQQMFLVAIFTDKIWEFLRFVQYVGFVVIGLLATLSFYHFTQVSLSLHL